MIEDKHIAVCVFSRGEGPNPMLRSFLRTRGFYWWEASGEYAIDAKRNQAVNCFLEERAEPFLVMLDADIVVLGETKPLFRESPHVDLAWAGVLGQDMGQVHLHSFGCAACRLSSKMLSQMMPPLFSMTYNTARDERIQCSCASFSSQASRMGFVAERLGVAGHRVPVTLVPDGPTRHKALLDCQLMTRG